LSRYLQVAPVDLVQVAAHIVQGPLISQRIVDNSDVTHRQLETMLDMIIRALKARP